MEEVNHVVVSSDFDDLLVEAAHRISREAERTRSAQWWLAECAYASPSGFAVWVAAQQSALHATLDIQNAALQTVQAALHAAFQGAKALVCRPSSCDQRANASLARWMTIAAPPGKGQSQPDGQDPVDPGSIDDWVASAMSFPPPLGMVAAAYADPDDA